MPRAPCGRVLPAGPNTQPGSSVAFRIVVAFLLQRWDFSKTSVIKLYLLPTGVAKGVDMCIELIGICLEQRDVTNIMPSEKKGTKPYGGGPEASWSYEFLSVEERKRDPSVFGVSPHRLCLGNHQ